MPQKQMKGGPKAAKKAGAQKRESKSISALRSAGMNPDGDDETGDVEDVAIKDVEVSEGVKERWKQLGGGGDEPSEDEPPKRKRIRKRECGSGMAPEAKKAGAQPEEPKPAKEAGTADLSELLKAMKKKKEQK